MPSRILYGGLLHNSALDGWSLQTQTLFAYACAEASGAYACASAKASATRGKLQRQHAKAHAHFGLLFFPVGKASFIICQGGGLLHDPQWGGPCRLKPAFAYACAEASATACKSARSFWFVVFSGRESKVYYMPGGGLLHDPQWGGPCRLKPAFAYACAEASATACKSARSFGFVVFSGRESKLSTPGKNNKPGIFMPGLSLR